MNGEQRPEWYFAHAQNDFAHVRSNIYRGSNDTHPSTENALKENRHTFRGGGVNFIKIDLSPYVKGFALNRKNRY